MGNAGESRRREEVPRTGGVSQRTTRARREGEGKEEEEVEDQEEEREACRSGGEGRVAILATTKQ